MHSFPALQYRLFLSSYVRILMIQSVSFGSVGARAYCCLLTVLVYMAMMTRMQDCSLIFMCIRGM